MTMLANHADELVALLDRAAPVAVQGNTRADIGDVATWNAANPTHLKGADGKWADVPDVGRGVVSDKLKGAGRIDLEPGERLLRSDRVRGEDGRAWLAVVEKDGKKSLRIGLGNAEFGTRRDDNGPWRAAEDRSYEINEERQELIERREDLENEVEELEAEPDADPAGLAARRAQLEELYQADTDEVSPNGHTAILDEAGARQLRETLAKALDEGEKIRSAFEPNQGEIDRLEARLDKLRHMGRKWTEEEDAEWDRLTAEVERLAAEQNAVAGPDRPERGYWVLAAGSIPGQWADVHYEVFLDDPTVGVETKLSAIPHHYDVADFPSEGASAEFAMSEADEFVRLLAKLESGTEKLGAARSAPARTRADVGSVAEWNAAHPERLKGADGKWADVPGVSAADKLKLGKLAPAGFTVRSSKKTKTDTADIGIAEVDSPDGPQVRIGVITSESGKWDAGFSGEGRKAQLRQQIAEKQALLDSDDEQPDGLEDDLYELERELEDLDAERTAVLAPDAMADLRRQIGGFQDLAKANKAKQDADLKAVEALEEQIDDLAYEHSDPDLELQIRKAQGEVWTTKYRLRLLRQDPKWAHAIPEAEADVAKAERELEPLLARRAELMPPQARAHLEDLQRQKLALNDPAIDIDDIITSAEVAATNSTRVRAEVWGSDDVDSDWVTSRLYVLNPGETTDDADQNDDYGYFRGLRGLNKLIAGFELADEEKTTRRLLGRFERAAGPKATHAGLAVLAADTGRMLMLQRALDDDDPAGGKWECPGGGIEDGETPLDAAKREWSEETGCVLPPGEVTGEWRSGIYCGYVYSVADEAAVEVFGDRDDVTNPDDPSGDLTEALAWWEPNQLTGSNPALREELRQSVPKVLAALCGNMLRSSTSSLQRMAGVVDGHGNLHSAADGKFVSKDVLKLADRIGLADGETFAGSDVLTDQDGTLVPLAFTHTPDGVRLRIGTGILDEDRKGWTGRNLGSTANLDEDGIRQMRGAVEQMRTVGADTDRRMLGLEKQQDALDARKRDILRRQHPDLTKDQVQQLDDIDGQLAAHAERLRFDRETRQERIDDLPPPERARWDAIEAELAHQGMVRDDAMQRFWASDRQDKDALAQYKEAQSATLDLIEEQVELHNAREIANGGKPSGEYAANFRRLDAQIANRERQVNNLQMDRDEISGEPKPLSDADRAELTAVAADRARVDAEHQRLAEVTVLEGTVPGQWADLVYRVETMEASGIYEDGGIRYSIAARAHDATDWTSSDTESTFSLTDLEKLGRKLDPAGSTTATRARLGLRQLTRMAGAPDEHGNLHSPTDGRFVSKAGVARTGVLGGVLDKLAALREKLGDDDRSELDQVMDRLRGLESSDVDDDDLIEDEPNVDVDADDDDAALRFESYAAGDVDLNYYTNGHIGISWGDGEGGHLLDSPQEARDVANLFDAVAAARDQPEAPSGTLIAEATTADGKWKVARWGGGSPGSSYEFGDPESVMADDPEPYTNLGLEDTQTDEARDFAAMLREIAQMAEAHLATAGPVVRATASPMLRMSGVADEHGNLHSPEDGKFVSKTGGVAGAAKAIGDWFRSPTYNKISTRGHIALDLVGLAPGFGEPFDLANAAWYLAERKPKNAFLSLGSAVPGFGYGTAAIKALKHIRTARALIDVRRTAKAAKVATAATRSAARLALGVPLDGGHDEQLLAEMRKRWGTDPRPWAVLHAHLTEQAGRQQADRITGRLFVAANGADALDGKAVRSSAAVVAASIVDCLAGHTYTRAQTLARAAWLDSGAVGVAKWNIEHPDHIKGPDGRWADVPGAGVVKAVGNLAPAKWVEPDDAVAMQQEMLEGRPWTQADLTAIGRYSPSSAEMNGLLRGGVGEGVAYGKLDDAGRARVHAAIAATTATMRPLPTAVKARRLTGPEAFGIPAGTPPEEVAERLRAMVGSSVREPAFMATSMREDFDFAAPGQIQMEIDVPAGTAAVHVPSARAAEQAAQFGYADTPPQDDRTQELLLAPGQIQGILGVDHFPGGPVRLRVKLAPSEKDTRGNMLNRAGKKAGVDPLELFTGPVSRARRYASEELMRWWARNERLNFTQFRAQVLGHAGDVAAAEKTRLLSNGKDFI